MYCFIEIILYYLSSLAGHIFASSRPWAATQVYRCIMYTSFSVRIYVAVMRVAPYTSSHILFGGVPEGKER